MQSFTLATRRQRERLEVTTSTYEAKWFLGDVYCCIIYVGMVSQDKHSFPESFWKTSSSPVNQWEEVMEKLEKQSV